MKKIIIIEKTGNIKSEKVKNFSIDDLYKKCKFKKKDNFKIRHTWSYKQNYYSLYARNTGRANSENKYDLPPPIDSELYFGSMVVIKHTKKTPKNAEVLDFEMNEWLKLYEHLFGGFEDLGDDDSEMSEDDIPDELKTKHGYLKDGFVVSSDGDDDEEYVPDNNENDDDDDEEELDDVDSDEEADYGGETDDEMQENFDEESEEDDDEFIDDDEDPASELSEEEYSY